MVLSFDCGYRFSGKLFRRDARMKQVTKLLAVLLLLSAAPALADHPNSSGGSSSSGGGGTPYMGVVATRSGGIDDSLATPNKQAMSRNFHLARIGGGNTIKSLKLVFSNYYGPETPTGAPDTITCSIEYPANTFNQCTFGGLTSSSIPSGGQITSDLITLSVPIPDGAKFWVRQYRTNTAGVHYSSAFCDVVNDASTFAASGVADQTMGGTVAQTNTVIGFFQYAIIGTTTQPSVCRIGDSREQGTISNTSANVTGIYLGQSSSEAYRYADLNLGVTADTASAFIAGHTGRLALSQYCTHIIDGYGINDIDLNGASAATLLGYQQTIAGYFPGKPFFLDTLSPHTTTSDNYATVANQTVDTNNAVIQSYNTSVRQFLGTRDYVTAVFDIASVTESSLASGKWQVSGTANYFTADGLHATFTGYALIRNSGIINTQLIHYP